MRWIIAFDLDLAMVALWLVLDYGMRHPRSVIARLVKL